ncbi:MAG TPA: hypothetical protein VGC67_04590 [Cellulomonas sp.]
MGENVRFQFGSGAWGGDLAGTPSLRVEIQDSDIAVVDYRPAPTGAGRFYLGFQPRDYHDDPSASEPVDLDAEAAGFAAWAELVGADDVRPSEVRRLLADEGVDEPLDTFVEETVERLVRLVGLPVPDGLSA